MVQGSGGDMGRADAQTMPALTLSVRAGACVPDPLSIASTVCPVVLAGWPSIHPTPPLHTTTVLRVCCSRARRVIPARCVVAAHKQAAHHCVSRIDGGDARRTDRGGRCSESGLNRGMLQRDGPCARQARVLRR